MLIEFRVENHRSIRDEQVLSMEAATDKGDKEDLRPRTVKGYKKKLLPVACLYGANASGKSNVLSALGWMRDAVLNSSRKWNPKEAIPRNPFAWGAKRLEPSMYEVVFLSDEMRYQYGFALSDTAVLEEWLYSWPNGKKQTWFERDEQTVHFGQHFKKASVDKEFRYLQKMMGVRALLLSTAVQFARAEFQPVFDWFYDLIVISLISTAGEDQDDGTQKSEEELSRLLVDLRQPKLVHDRVSPHFMVTAFRDFLKHADVGIVDFKAVKGNLGSKFALKHEGANGSDTWLSLEEESKGTQTLFRIGVPILKAIYSGRTIIVDELESSLHPTLARYIVELFNSASSNPKNAQLIFTSHDTNLLGTTIGNPELRRDEIWLTEKNRDGATVVYPLTEFKPRAGENIQRGYLQGRYGAVPFLGRTPLFKG